MSLPRLPVALLRYSTRNLGDDIQTFAVRQFIEPDIWIDRDRLRISKHECHLVLFGWLLQTRQWPPKCTRVTPLSIHAAYRSRKLLEKHIGWWKHHEPVSCRDASTAEFFTAAGIHAAVEGCVTLTLKRWLPREMGTVVLVDIDLPTEQQPRIAFPKCESWSHHLPLDRALDQQYRQQRTIQVLEAYQRAELVITSRLHAMLPCLAFGTPVVYVENRTRSVVSHYSRILDYMPYVSVWDGVKSFETGEPSPTNYVPHERIAAVEARVKKVMRVVTLP